MQYPPLLPPVGVWAVSQSPCGRPPSQAGYRALLWWACTSPPGYSDAGPSYTSGNFHTVSCDTVRLCGIISRFQLLSPGIGQVTHALLTRPPLSYYKSTRRSQHNNSVRLACVRHAASVHPEPGSNSQFIIRSGQNHLLTLSVFYFFSHTPGLVV